MKFVYPISIAALFGSFAVATPVNTLFFSLSLKDGDVTRLHGEDAINKGYRQTDEAPLCWLKCVPQPLECPEGMENTHYGKCYTCCTSPSVEDNAKAKCANKPTLSAAYKDRKPGL